MIVPGALERRELQFVEVFQVDAAHLRAERGPGRNNVDRFNANVACHYRS